MLLIFATIPVLLIFFPPPLRLGHAIACQTFLFPLFLDIPHDRPEGVRRASPIFCPFDSVDVLLFFPSCQRDHAQARHALSCVSPPRKSVPRV